MEVPINGCGDAGDGSALRAIEVGSLDEYLPDWGWKKGRSIQISEIFKDT